MKHLFVVLLLFFASNSVIAQTCSSTKRCELGCCNSNGVCGYGPDYCGSKCISDCGRKSECNPGFGSKWAERDKCPLNVCCSKFGFCGQKVKRPSCSKNNGIPKVIGYYEGWATTQRICNQFYPEQLPIGIYTHINFAFATIDPKTFQVLPAEKADKSQYERLMLLKKKDPDLKIFIAIGGWAFNDPGATRTTFSDLAASVPRQKAFISSLISFMSTYGFDGVDIDWEYPAADDRAGREVDFANFPKFMARLKSALAGSGRNGITVTIPASYWYLQHFDLKALAKEISWFNLMSYDLHGTWDKGNRWTGNFLNAHTNLTEISDALDLIWRNDIEPKQVVLGLGFYGRSFTATSSSCVSPGCTFESGGQKGSCSGELGILLNSEIDEIVKKNNIKPKLYQKEAVKVATWGNQWVAYDDEETLKMKSEFAQSQCLGGLMVWAVSHDTEDAKYSKALGRVANRKFTSLPATDGDETTTTIDTKHDQCKWTNCGEGCPSGWALVRRSDDGARGKEYMLDESGCDGDGSHSFCCPTDDPMPECGWYTHNNGNCDEQCPSGTTEIGSNSKYCKKRYQAACCTTDTRSMKLYTKCEWGQYPLCSAATCPWKDSSKDDQIALSTTGSGGATCNMLRATLGGDVWEVQERSLCCDSSNSKESFSDCEWYTSYGPAASGRTQENFCRSGCPDDRIRVALDQLSQDCYKKGGARARCCTPQFKTSITVENPQLEEYRASLNNFMRAPQCLNEKSLKQRRSVGILDREIKVDTTYTGVSTITERQESQNSIDRKTVVAHLTAIFASTASKAMRDAEIKIWDEGVESRFPNLKYATLAPWLKKLKSYKTEGPLATFRRLVCKMNYWNGLVGGGSSTIVCNYTNACEWYEGGCDPEDGPLIPKRNNDMGATLQRARLYFEDRGDDTSEPVTQRDITRLEKRALRPYNVPLTDANGQSFIVTLQLPPHPSSGNLGVNSPLHDEAVDYIDEDDCGLTDLEPRRYTTPTPGSRRYELEHIFDGGRVSNLMQDATHGRLPSGAPSTSNAVPAAFFHDIQTMNLPNPPVLAGGLHSNDPYTRVMECLGSSRNREVFALLAKDINQAKGKIIFKNKIMADGTFERLMVSDPGKVLSALRNALATITYLNLETRPNIRRRLAIVVRCMYTEWKRIEEQWMSLNPLQTVNMSGFFQEWIVAQYAWYSDETEIWVQNGIDSMHEYWDAQSSVRAAEVLEILRALEEQVGEQVNTDSFFPPIL